MKRMKSMYVRQVAILLGLTFLCMVLLGVGFFTLSYRYQLQEIQTTLDRNAGFISSYADAALTKGGSLTDESFVNYIHSVVLLTDTTVLVCDTDGQVLCAAGSNLNQEAFNTPLQNLYVPNWAVNQLLRGSEYSGMTTFNQLLSSRCYLTSEVLSPLTQDPKDPAGLVPSGMATGFLFVAADATSVSEFLHSTLQLFLITAMVVLLISLIICSITVQRMVDPLKGMCAFAHKFAHGEVDTRVTEYANRDDEIGELAIAFNAMADSLAQAEQKRSEFVANVSHELKTPMTTIAGFADGILDGTIPPEKERESLQVISSETRRLSRLVRRMLELSRLQSSERVSAQEQFDAAELLIRVLVSLEAKITENRAARRPRDGLGRPGRGDAGLLQPAGQRRKILLPQGEADPQDHVQSRESLHFHRQPGRDDPPRPAQPYLRPLPQGRFLPLDPQGRRGPGPLHRQDHPQHLQRGHHRHQPGRVHRVYLYPVRSIMVFGFAKWIKSLVLTLRPYVGTLRSADCNVALIRLLRSHLPPRGRLS